MNNYGLDSETAEELIRIDGFLVLHLFNESLVIPGFVDGHTHPVFDGDRSNEFAMKLAGAGYMEIHKQGGGIHYTVNGQ